jgi:hypothetical protein
MPNFKTSQTYQNNFLLATVLESNSPAASIPAGTGYNNGLSILHPHLELV